jgi:hypothetical protein
MNTEEIREALKDTIVVVSGIPRSGTSMMMQMLDIGGIEILSDHKRKADKSNPKGYYELSAVKNLAKDNSCIKEAPGKAVKVISQLLEYLPKEFTYKIIFMLRDMEEIIKSQQKMLGKEDSEKEIEIIKKIFVRDIRKVDDWTEKNQNVDIFKISYTDILNNPLKEIDKINSFLGLELNAEKMSEIVDPKLYRSKS